MSEELAKYRHSFKPDYSLGEAADILGLSFYGIRYLVRRGKLPVKPRINAREHYRIAASTLEEMYPEEWNEYLARRWAK